MTFLRRVPPAGPPREPALRTQHTPPGRVKAFRRIVLCPNPDCARSYASGPTRDRVLWDAWVTAHRPHGFDPYEESQPI